MPKGHIFPSLPSFWIWGNTGWKQMSGHDVFPIHQPTLIVWWVNGGVSKTFVFYCLPSPWYMLSFSLTDMSQLSMHLLFRVSTSPSILVIRLYHLISFANASCFAGVNIMANNSERNKKINKNPTNYSSKSIIVIYTWNLCVYSGKCCLNDTTRGNPFTFRNKYCSCFHTTEKVRWTSCSDHKIFIKKLKYV